MEIGKVRIKPRFIMVLAVLAVSVFLLVRACTGGEKTESVRLGNTGDNIKTQVVLVRNEPVYYSDQLGSVDYVATEGSRVQEGDLIARVYFEGRYVQQKVEDLYNTEQEIKASQIESLDTEIIDSQLDGMNEEIDAIVERFESGIGQRAGSLLTFENELVGAMNVRQDHIRMSMLDNKKLETLYTQANNFRENISNWQTEVRASSEGIVSFYMDRYENFLSQANLGSITASHMRNILRGEIPELPMELRVKQAIYRSVQPGTWYALFIVPKNDWKLTLHQPCTIRLEDYISIAFDATVIRQTEDGNNIFVQLEIPDGAEKLMDIRITGAEISSHADGLLVPVSAVVTSSGEQCVRVKEGQGERLVPVIIHAQDRYNVLVSPKVEGALMVNMQVFVK